MEQTVTAKLRLYISDPSPFLETTEAYVEACNFVSDLVYDSMCMKAYEIREEVYHTLREKYLLKSQMADSVCRTVVGSYKTMFTQGRWDKAKYRQKTYDLVRGRDYTFDFEGRRISLNTLGGRVKDVPFVAKGFERYLEKGTLGTARLQVRKDGKFFLLVPVTYDIPDPPTKVNTIVGIDRGLRFAAVTYDGKKAKFYSQKQVVHRRRQFRRVRHQLQARGTKSALRRLKRIGSRENRWMNDVNHCLSKTLAQSYPAETAFALEDLSDVKKVEKKVRHELRRDIVSWAFGDLASKLEYKAWRRGQLILYVDPRYTSQTCPKCGAVIPQNRDKHKHIFHCCCCSYRVNDDLAAAQNIYLRGKQMFKT